MNKTKWYSTPSNNTNTIQKWLLVVVLSVSMLLSPCDSFHTPMTHNGMRFHLSSSSSVVVPSIPSRRLSSSSSSSSSQQCGSSSALYIRRQLLSEDDLVNPPNKNVLDAVEGMGGSMLLASDVAAKAGVSLSEAQKSLSALASLTRGDIAVTSSGDLLYSFPSPSVKAALAANNLRYRVQSTWATQVWPKLFYGIRVGFGVSIFVSLLAIAATFFFISQGGGSSDDDRDDRRGGGGRGGGGFGNMMMLDMFYPRPLYFSSGPNYGYYGRYDPYAPQRQRQRSRQRSPYGQDDYQDDEEEEPNFFEKIFSYIFGDGDPNRNLETARLRLAAEVIRDNGGAVVAEQLAPFCDVEDPDDLDGAIVDEGFVLPIVTQLGGEPTVTDDGDIVYLFPDLQVSAGVKEDDDQIRDSLSRRRMEMMGEDGEGNAKRELLQEERTEFSRTGTFGKALAGGLGVVNLGGALYLGQLLSTLPPAVQLPGMYGLVQSGYPLLLAYAFLYNTIPAARFLYLQKTNAQVDERNSARRRWLTRLKESGDKVGRKLKAAKGLRQKMRNLGSGKVDMAYDTRDDFTDVEKEKEMESLKKFDDLLKDDTGSFE